MEDLIGRTLGHYRIVEQIGAGGMGVVYRAHDERLNRDVAIKVLPEVVAENQDRLARFEREAKLLASLNHSNIATLYGLEDEGKTRFLVMELVEGQSLATVIARGALPADEAVPIAIQIAQALEAAHEQGVIHRDLKPANVMVNTAGKVKVLDFGLAKALHPDRSSTSSAESVAESPTLTADMTRAGVILGTAAYMSPEQARGQAVDSRADIWAFGVVLWEMLTGRRLFEGNATSDVLAAVLRDEPDWDALPDNLFPAVYRLLRRCLRRDPARRLRHIGDARLELEEASEESAFTAPEVPPGFGSAEIGTERTWPLTTDVCRHLNRETLDPAVIGDELAYLDNDRRSDVLVLYLPGFGFGHRVFAEVLGLSPYRGIAVTMFGFEEDRRRRIPLPLGDHLTLLRLFLEEVVDTVKPRTTVLCGFSASADITLRMIFEGGIDRRHVDGVLALSPNVSLDTCFFSRRVAEISEGGDREILDIAREVAAAMQTPQAWLQMSPYLMELVRKYHADVDALRTHAKDLIAPFLGGGESPLAGWYRAAKAKGVGVRVVFAGEEESEQNALRELKLSHIDQQVFGPDFDDVDIVNEANAFHMGLMDARVIERHLDEFLTLLGEAGVSGES
jgi:predicted Ser/Thr protein kinase/pimeloyl-ACP methyl ester carboxylesterase